MRSENGEIRELPRGWTSANIGSFGEVITGSTPPKKDPSFFGGTIPFYKPTDLDAGYVVVKAREYLSELGASQSRIIPAFSILVTCIGATIGKTGLTRRKCATNQQINAVILPLNYINPKWLFWMVSSAKGRQMIIDNSSATTMPILNKSRFSELSFPIPPFQEQERIVEKIEELFSDVDQGVESLKTAQKQLKVYRQAVLKWAFEGKLTEAWRSQQPTLKTGEVLLAQIKAERENRYQQKLAEWEEKVREWEAIGKVGKKLTKPQKLKELPPLNKSELSVLPPIPTSWAWVFPEGIAAIDSYSLGIGPFGSNLKVSDYKTDGMPLIFVRHITSGNFDLDSKYVSQEKFEELLPHSAKPLDLLITKMGDPPGDCEIYPQGRKQGIITSDCLKFRVWDNFINRKFYKYCTNSNLIKKQLGLITKGVAQKKISLERFKSLKFPLPSLEEQEQIVEEIESRLSICDQLEATIIENLQKAEALRQSILKQAFEGKLVPQDPNDEPAEKLLERIRAERQEKESQKTSKPLR